MQRAPFFVTQHAIERFRERFAGGLSFGKAKYELLVIACGSARLRATRTKGEEQWIAGDGSGLVFVVKNDAARGRTAVTVLTSQEADDAA